MPDGEALAHRHGYAPPASRRAFALAGTALICAAFLAGIFLTFNHRRSLPAPSAPLVVTLLPLASQPETPPKENPKLVEKKAQRPEPPRAEPVERTMASADVSVPVPIPVPKPVDPGPKEPETAAPRSIPAQPAPQVSSNAPDSWEGRMLAHLNKNRRYPVSAMARRQQGVPYVRFVMDREGRVLSSRLERSSGFDALDREAVTLPKRAQPLPKPPADKPGASIELVVPVEFFMR